MTSSKVSNSRGTPLPAGNAWLSREQSLVDQSYTCWVNLFDARPGALRYRLRQLQGGALDAEIEVAVIDLQHPHRGFHAGSHSSLRLFQAAR